MVTTWPLAPLSRSGSGGDAGDPHLSPRASSPPHPSLSVSPPLSFLARVAGAPILSWQQPIGGHGGTGPCYGRWCGILAWRRGRGSTRCRRWPPFGRAQWQTSATWRCPHPMARCNDGDLLVLGHAARLVLPPGDDEGRWRETIELIGKIRTTHCFPSESLCARGFCAQKSLLSCVRDSHL